MAKYLYHRVDANAEAIWKAVEQAGATVSRSGPLDAVVGFRGENFLVEVKTPTGRLRPSQKRFLSTWKGQAAVIRTVDEALALLQAMGRY